MPLGDTFIRPLLNVFFLDDLVATRSIILTRSEFRALSLHGVGYLAAAKMLVDLVCGDDRYEWQDHRACKKNPPEDAVDEDHADKAGRPNAHGDGVLANSGRHFIAGPRASIGDQLGRASAARLGGNGCVRTRLAISHHVSLRLLPDDLEYSIA
jgi:hypothetical protein